MGTYGRLSEIGNPVDRLLFCHIILSDMFHVKHLEKASDFLITVRYYRHMQVSMFHVKHVLYT